MHPPPRVRGALQAHAPDSLFTRRVLLPGARFILVEEIAGGPLVVAAAIALAWANSPFGTSYDAFWGSEIAVSTALGSHVGSLRHWIDEALLPLLFFVAGLELKRELVDGELSTSRRAAFPVATAVGGMLVPALVYVALNLGPHGTLDGWGVPLATDIAFALAVLALAGPRVPAELKTIVLAFAAVDDVGAVLVIALFYAHDAWSTGLVGAAGCLAVVLALRAAGVRQLFPYWIAGAGFCALLSESGVHPTAGAVVLGLLAPARPFFARKQMIEGTVGLADRLSDLQARLRGGSDAEENPRDLRERQAEILGRLEALSSGTEPITERLSRQVNPWVSYGILPLFALANAGVVIDGGAIERAFGDPAALGVVAGLTVGKPIGFLAFAWIAVALGLAERPERIGWGALAATSLLAGIGFTVSLFIAELAFGGSRADQLPSVKMAILAASLASGLAGGLALRCLPAPGRSEPS